MAYNFTPDEIKNNLDRILTAFGFALKAGKCSVGGEKCVEDIRADKAKLVIVPNDISDNTKKRIFDSCSYHNTEVLTLPCTKNELSKRFGKTSEVSCAAITDSGFVKIIDKLYTDIHTSLTEVQQ